MRALFDGLRAAAMALNPAITEEFAKLYITYHSEEVFTSVIPLSGKLRIVLNMPFPELQDVRGVGRDVTDIGHWGRGDVSVDLDQQSDIPYVMGLVRQAYEWQLDGEGGD